MSSFEAAVELLSSFEQKCNSRGGSAGEDSLPMSQSLASSAEISRDGTFQEVKRLLCDDLRTEGILALMETQLKAGKRIYPIVSSVLKVASLSFQPPLSTQDSDSEEDMGEDNDFAVFDSIRRAVVLRVMELLDSELLQRQKDDLNALIGLFPFEIGDFDTELLNGMMNGIVERMKPRHDLFNENAATLESSVLIPTILSFINLDPETGPSDATNALLAVVEQLPLANEGVDRVKLLKNIRDVSIPSEGVLDKVMECFADAIATSPLAVMPDVLYQFLEFSSYSNLPVPEKAIIPRVAKHLVQCLEKTFGDPSRDLRSPSCIASFNNVIHRIFTKVKQNHKLGLELVKFIRSRDLASVSSFGLLMSLAQETKLKKDAFEFMRSLVWSQFQDSDAALPSDPNSPWPSTPVGIDIHWHLRVAPHLKQQNNSAETLRSLAELVAASNDALVQPLIDFAMYLISGNRGTAFGQEIGQDLVRVLFERLRDCREKVLERLVHQINSAEIVGPEVQVLTELISNYATALAQNNESKLHGFIDMTYSGMSVAPAASQALFSALLPVLVHPGCDDLRSAAVMALRKSIATRPAEDRIAAMRCLMLLVHRMAEQKTARNSPRRSGNHSARSAASLSEQEVSSLASETMAILKTAQTRPVKVVAYALLVELADTVPELREAIFYFFKQRWLGTCPLGQQRFFSILLLEDCVAPFKGNEHLWKQHVGPTHPAEGVLDAMVTEPRDELLQCMVRCLQMEIDENAPFSLQRAWQELWDEVAGLVFALNRTNRQGEDEDPLDLNLFSFDADETDYHPIEPAGVRNCVRAKMFINIADVLAEFYGHDSSTFILSHPNKALTELQQELPIIEQIHAPRFFFIQRTLLSTVLQQLENSKKGAARLNPQLKFRLQTWLASSTLVSLTTATAMFVGEVSKGHFDAKWSAIVYQLGKTCLTHVTKGSDESLQLGTLDMGTTLPFQSLSMLLHSAATCMKICMDEDDEDDAKRLVSLMINLICAIFDRTVSQNRVPGKYPTEELAELLDTFNLADRDFLSRSQRPDVELPSHAALLEALVGDVMNKFLVWAKGDEAERIALLVQHLVAVLGSERSQLADAVTTQLASKFGIGTRPSVVAAVASSPDDEDESAISDAAVRYITGHRKTFSRTLFRLYVAATMTSQLYEPVAHTHKELDTQSDEGRPKPNATAAHPYQPLLLCARHVRTLYGNIKSDQQTGVPGWKLMTTETAEILLQELVVLSQVAVTEAATVLKQFRAVEDGTKRSKKSTPEMEDDERTEETAIDIRCQVYDHLRVVAEVIHALLGADIPIKHAVSVIQLTHKLFEALHSATQDLNSRKESQPPSSFRELVRLTNDKTQPGISQVFAEFYIKKQNEAIKLDRKAGAKEKQPKGKGKQKGAQGESQLISKIDAATQKTSAMQERFEELLLKYEQKFVLGPKLTRWFQEISGTDFQKKQAQGQGAEEPENSPVLGNSPANSPKKRRNSSAKRKVKTEPGTEDAVPRPPKKSRT